jgi:hypothetical protein
VAIHFTSIALIAGLAVKKRKNACYVQIHGILYDLLNILSTNFSFSDMADKFDNIIIILIDKIIHSI